MSFQGSRKEVKDLYLIVGILKGEEADYIDLSNAMEELKAKKINEHVWIVTSKWDALRLRHLLLGHINQDTDKLLVARVEELSWWRFDVDL